MIARIFNIDNSLAVRLVECGDKFYGKLGKTISPDVFIPMWNKLLEAGIGTLWVSHDGPTITGGLGMVLSPCMFDGVIQADETFWFVDPKHRGDGIRLFNTMIEWAKSLEITRISMVSLNDVTGDRVSKFYETRGFAKVETRYMKELWP